MRRIQSFDASVNSAEALIACVPEALGKHYEIAYPGRNGQRRVTFASCHFTMFEQKAHSLVRSSGLNALSTSIKDMISLTLVNLTGLIKSGER